MILFKFFGCYHCGTGYFTQDEPLRCGKCGAYLDRKREEYVRCEQAKEHKNNHSYFPAYDSKDGGPSLKKWSKYGKW